MDATRWQRVEQLFHQALELRAEARDAYLHAACGDDRALRAEVESLLAQAPHSDRFLNVPALELAAATNAPVDAPPRRPRRRSTGRGPTAAPCASAIAWITTACCASWAKAAWAWCSRPKTNASAGAWR